MTRPGARTPGREAGTSLAEALIAAGTTAVVILSTLAVADSALTRTGRAKEIELARLAVSRAGENLAAVRFRGDNATDNGQWLFRGGYELARNPDDSAFLMPDVRTVSRSTEDGIGGCVIVEFPVPGLQPPAGRTRAGRLALYTDETLQPVSIPTTKFPFPPTAGFARLDLDGDGAFVTTDVRTGHDLATRPCRLVPARISVEWVSERGATERYSEHLLLSYQGIR